MTCPMCRASAEEPTDWREPIFDEIRRATDALPERGRIELNITIDFDEPGRNG
jgi:hypothetical protein